MSAAIKPTREVPLQFESHGANGMTPLMRAVCDDSVDVVRTLLEDGADVNAKRTDGFTALSLAAFFGRTRIVELLLERGADVRAVTRFDTSPEMWATARGFQEIVDLLRDIPKTAITSDEQVSHTGAPSTVPRILPEIHDLPPLIAPAFHPGHVFLTRISSDRRSLAALAVALIVTLGLALFATYQIRSLLRDDAEQKASTDNTLVPEPQAAVAQPDEPQPPQESGSNHELGSKQHVTADLPNKTASGPSEESTPLATMVKPSIKTLPIPRSSHLVSTVRRDTVIRSEQLKQAAEPEIESKPAPLIVEVSRDRNTTSATVTQTADPPPPQSAPLGITSRKPRAKVIQWP